MKSASSYTRVLLATVAPVALLAMAGVVQAQTAPAAAPAPAASGGIADIVVTARRTGENLQTVPVAVTALNTAALEERQVSQVLDLARTAPSLSIGTGGTGPATIVYLAIRGQAQNSPNSFSDAAVGIYIDGIYVARPMVGNLGFLDPASAEVLRGPQGTLFGRNTTGGALNLTSVQPKLGVTEGYLKVGFGNYSQTVTEGVVNFPVTDDLAVRFAGRYDKHGAYFPNPDGPGAGAIKGDYFGRGSVRWEPKDTPIKLDVTGDYNHYQDSGNPTAVSAINPNGPLAAFYGISQAMRTNAYPGTTKIPLGKDAQGNVVYAQASTFTDFSRGPIGPITQFINPAFNTAGNSLSHDWRTTYGGQFTGIPEIDTPGNFNEAWSMTGNLQVDLGAVKVKSLTGYRWSNTHDSLDLTGTDTGGGAFYSQYRQHQFSEELQASGDTGKLHYMFGGIYFREAGTELSDSQIFYNTPIATGGDHTYGGFVSTSKGLFAQLNYSVTDALRLTGGIRYTWDTRKVDLMGSSPFANPGAYSGAGAPTCQNPPPPHAPVPVPAGGCHYPESASFQYPAWLASADYKVSRDIFLYLKTSGASNSGGFNSRPVPPPNSTSFKPESVRDIEAGFKGEFLDRHVRTNVAIFNAWQANVQRIVNTTFVDANGQTKLTQYVTNDGKARTYGLEFEGTVIPWSGMEIGGSFAYLHAAYVKGTRNETQILVPAGKPTTNPDTGAVTPGSPAVTDVVDRSGEPITQAPKWTANASITQTFRMATGDLKLHADYSYISERYFDYYTTGDPAQKAAVAVANQASLIRAYGLLNLQATYTFKNPAIEIELWGKNVANKANFTNVFNSYTGLGATVQYQGAPRTYGATVKYSF